MFQKRKSNIDESQLSHTKYDCQYHIVFIPKFRRKAIYGKLRRDIGVILRRLCEYKGVEIVEAMLVLIIYICWLRFHLKLVYHNLWDI